MLQSNLENQVTGNWVQYQVAVTVSDHTYIAPIVVIEVRRNQVTDNWNQVIGHKSA